MAGRLAAVVVAVVLFAPDALAASGALDPLTVQGGARLASPLPSRVAAQNPPQVRIDLPESAGKPLLFIDNVDVTPLARISGNAMVFRPPAPLDPGEHRIRLVVESGGRATESEWTFSAPAPGPGRGAKSAGARNEVYAQGGISVSASRTFSGKSTATRIPLIGSLNETVGYKRGATEASVSAGARYYNNDPKEKAALTGINALLRHDRDSLEYGDVSFRGTPLLAPSLARRGVLATLNHVDTELQLFQVRTQSVVGTKTGVDFSDYSNQTYGGAITRSLVGDNAVKATAAYLAGRDSLGGNSPTTASLDGPSRGRAAGVLVTGRILTVDSTVEGAWSDFDPDANDPEASRRDAAVSVQLARAVRGVNLTGSYQRLGPDFATVANPNGTKDRQTFGAGVSGTLGIASLSASASRSNDNIKNDAARPVAVDTSAGATATLASAGWPALTFSYMRGVVKSTKEPSGTPHTQNVTDTATAGLSYARQGWSSSLSSSFSWMTAEGASGVQGSTTGSHQLSLSLQPSPRAGVASSLGWTRSTTGGATRETRLASVNVNVVPWTNLLTLSGQGSVMFNTATDNAADTRQYSGGVRASFEIHELVKRWFSYGRQSLAVSYTYNRSEDEGAPANDREDHTAYVGIDLYLPVEGRYAF